MFAPAKIHMEMNGSYVHVYVSQFLFPGCQVEKINKYFLLFEARTQNWKFWEDDKLLVRMLNPWTWCKAVAQREVIAWSSLFPFFFFVPFPRSWFRLRWGYKKSSCRIVISRRITNGNWISKGSRRGARLDPHSIAGARTPPSGSQKIGRWCFRPPL